MSLNCTDIEIRLHRMHKEASENKGIIFLLLLVFKTREPIHDRRLIEGTGKAQKPEYNIDNWNVKSSIFFPQGTIK
jgi:hypothetical protein